MRRAALPLALALASCAAPGEPGLRAILAWRLVEVEACGGKELVLEPDERTPERIEVRLFRERAGVGEVVEAEIWLPGAIGLHWIEVRPDRPGVQILGPVEVAVEGAQSVRVRFTCATAGRGGIVVIVRE